ncbi:MAG: efflux RND transporter periplasmic adaptor subunit [Bacteroidota bacterium]
MKRGKILKILGIVVGAVILMMIIGRSCGMIKNKGTINVTVEKAEKRTIVETVSANGKIQPAVEVKVCPDVSGEVIELNVKEGDEVKAGQLLAKINPDLYQSNLERMSASLNTNRANQANSKARAAQTKAQFIQIESSYKRNEKLFKQGVISESEFEQAKAQYEAGKADVEAADQSVIAANYNIKSGAASLKEAQDNLRKTAIYAPVDGTISKLSCEKGERVVGASQFSAPEIMRIANLNEMEVNVDVNENDIIRVKLGDTAIIDIDAFLDRKFKGVVSEIATSATTTGVTADQVTNFVVKIRIVRESYADMLVGKPANFSPFHPGMTATVDIQTKKVIDALSIPIQAVTTRVDSTKIPNAQMKADKTSSDNSMSNASKSSAKTEECVFIYQNGKVKKVIVKTGIQDSNYIQILEGITEKDEVVSGPYRAVSKKLNDGDAVNKVDKKDLFAKGESE